MSHDDFEFEPVRGLPAELPKGEQLLWQGAPEWKSLAVHAYHVRKVAGYFGVLVAWRLGMGLYNGHTSAAMAVSCVLLLAFGALAVGMLSLLAYLNARSTVYSITSRRVILRHGVAVSLTMTVPFRLIDSADVKTHGDKTGDISLALPAQERVGYLITWPHVRAGRLTKVQPSFRSLTDYRHAADILGAALAADAGTKAIRLEIPAATPAPEAPPGLQRPRVVEPQSAGSRSAATA
jgi:hypothetical protein